MGIGLGGETKNHIHSAGNHDRQHRNSSRRDNGGDRQGLDWRGLIRGCWRWYPRARRTGERERMCQKCASKACRSVEDIGYEGSCGASWRRGQLAPEDRRRRRGVARKKPMGASGCSSSYRTGRAAFKKNNLTLHECRIRKIA
jgi:hypothetical protein